MIPKKVYIFIFLEFFFHPTFHLKYKIRVRVIQTLHKRTFCSKKWYFTSEKCFRIQPTDSNLKM